jgi:hypothetical protein
MKQFAPYALNLRSAPIFFKQIYSNLAPYICPLRSTSCIFSQILDALYALRPMPDFYEIHPRSFYNNLQNLIHGNMATFLGTFNKSTLKKFILDEPIKAELS